MPECKLCKKGKKLCRSHIIPEKYYKELYSKNPRRLHVLSNSKGDKIKFPQKGIREKLFCRDCEDIFMNLEQYAEKVIDKIKSKVYAVNDINYINSVDYEKFKLFQNSILFRASVCTEEFFQTINIGMHEERLRKRILYNNPGKPHEYPCSLTLLVEDFGISEQLIMYPDFTVDPDNNRRYRFVFGGFIWTFFASLFPPPIDFKLFYLKKDGILKYYCIHRKNVQYIDRYLQEVQKAGKFKELKLIMAKYQNN
jgi:hypothetical protein